MSSNKELFTIGHSNLGIEAFISLLQKHGVNAVADVRSHPYSRYLAHFNKSELEAALRKKEIEYNFLGRELGARPNDASCYVNGRAAYERIAATQLFERGIQCLLQGVKGHKIALMCAERDPMTCHRSILVCQRLRSVGLNINHILSNGEIESHEALEKKLLNLHGLAQSETLTYHQLSFFDEPQFQESSDNNKTEEDCLKEAYRRQGDKIAYRVDRESHNHEEIN